MNLSWSAECESGLQGEPMYHLKIRTEHELILTQQAFAGLKGQLAELGLKDAVALAPIFFDTPPHLRELLFSDWKDSRPNKITFDDLKRLIESDSEIKVFLEGSCVEGMFFVVQQRGYCVRKSVNEASLELLKKEIVAYKTELEAGPLKPIIKEILKWLPLALDVINTGIDAWRLRREEQELARQQREREAQKKEEERVFRERIGRGIDHSAGGPAFDDFMDRIGRTG